MGEEKLKTNKKLIVQECNEKKYTKEKIRSTKNSSTATVWNIKEIKMAKFFLLRYF